MTNVFLLGWLSKYLTERNLILLIFALIATGFLMAGLATTIPLLLSRYSVSAPADALAKSDLSIRLGRISTPLRFFEASADNRAIGRNTNV